MRWYARIRRLACCLGLLIFIGTLVVGASFLLIWTFFTGCNERVAQTIPSPTGEFTALQIAEGCGGAAGSVQIKVRLRRTAEPSAEDETILVAPSHDFDFRMTWLDANTLAIDYGLSPDYQKWVTIRPPTRDIVLAIRPYQRRVGT
jgi:hypothetical protein